MTMLRRLPIVARLVVAFLLVSLLPIATLAGVALYESTEPAHVQAEGNEEPPREQELLGLRTDVIELSVAAFGLAASVLVAVAVGRTVVRPLRDLERTIERVDTGDTSARADVTGEDELGRVAASFNKMLVSLEREAMIRDLFGQYVTPELADAAIDDPARLEGQLVTSTVLFADIRDFTGLSESVPASELLALLNRYFDRMARVIVDAGGLVNKLGGDSLLAVFGSPLNPDKDHAAEAVSAAREMERTLADFNEEQRHAFLPEVMIGIGIASGDVVAGNVGSSAKLEYTVIGDAVNVAARLQELTKELGVPILLSAETARLTGDAALFADVGDVDVRGKARPVRVVRLEHG
jgi:adenylate cyclase